MLQLLARNLFTDHGFLLLRIPLPELKDSDKLDKIMYMKEATKRIRLGPENLPSICFYSFLNAYQVITRRMSDMLTGLSRDGPVH